MDIFSSCLTEEDDFGIEMAPIDNANVKSLVKLIYCVALQFLNVSFCNTY